MLLTDNDSKVSTFTGPPSKFHSPPEAYISGSFTPIMKKCNTWSLEVATIPRHVKLQNIKGIANILHHIHCNTNKNNFKDDLGILHKKL